MKQLVLLEHPVIEHKLGYLRNKDTLSAEFRLIIKELTRFLVFEASKDLKTEDYAIETPIAPTTASRIENPPLLVSVMRAGNGMLEALMEAMPFASAGHIGIYRDKFIKNTVEYYFKLPDNIAGKTVYLAEPLIATGDTVIACVDRLKQYGVGEIRVLTLLCSQQGLNETFSMHPDIKIYALSIEKELTPEGYLVPGLGDAGDRLYNSGGDLV